MSAPSIKKIITDLAELRSAIRRSKRILVIVRDDDGHFICFVQITKQEALDRAVITDRFDDYSAEWDSYGGGELTLNHERVADLRETRRPHRRQARHAEALTQAARYQSAGQPIPEWLETKLRDSAPPMVLEHGTATIATA